MNRRGFLRALAVAPLAAPMAIKATLTPSTATATELLKAGVISRDEARELGGFLVPEEYAAEIKAIMSSCSKIVDAETDELRARISMLFDDPGSAAAVVKCGGMS